MARRLSAATERALARVAAGETRYHAAKAEHICQSTMYRAWNRLKKSPESLSVRGDNPLSGHRGRETGQG